MPTLFSHLNDEAESQPSRWWPVVMFFIGLGTCAGYCGTWWLIMRAFAAHNGEVAP